MLNGYVTQFKSYNGYNTVVYHEKFRVILKYLHNYPKKTKNLYLIRDD